MQKGNLYQTSYVRLGQFQIIGPHPYSSFVDFIILVWNTIGHFRSVIELLSFTMVSELLHAPVRNP